jgi:hypothetical protein
MRLLSILGVGLVLAGAAAAGPPPRGLVVPGQSFGGLRLGLTAAQVQTMWGSGRGFAAGHGVCRDCAAPTWFFTYRRFAPEGVAVVFRRGRVSALYTLWSPPGWRTNRGLRIGDVQARITDLYGVLVPTPCSGYQALTLPQHTVVTSFYVVDQKVWGFGLSRAGAPLCR